jgi:hypothetical protein
MLIPLLCLWIGFAAGFGCAAIFAANLRKQASDDDAVLKRRIDARVRRLPIDYGQPSSPA